MVYCTECGIIFPSSAIFCTQCGSKKYIPIGTDRPLTTTDEQELISYYFGKYFPYHVIVLFLKTYHGITMSTRTLKRRLRKFGLKRRQANVNEPVLRRIIEQELQGPTSTKGYRGLWYVLRCSYGIITPRDTVMRLLRDVDPVGSIQRRSRRLHRRQYNSPGPNNCWHVDGYDKLKPYGLPIHGCVDGFSRKVLWLNVSRTNKNPLVPAYLFLQKVRDLGFCPDLIQTDCGTENGIMADVQCYFLQNRSAHRYGASPSNQRIENWWSFHRRAFTGWVIDFFKDLVNRGILLTGNHIHMECVWFVFSELLQLQLDQVRYQWNIHYIRKSRHGTIGGIPDVLFYTPDVLNYVDQKNEVSEEMIYNVLLQRDIISEGLEVINDEDTELFEYFRYVVRHENIEHPPKNWQAARIMFGRIVGLCT